MNNYFKRVFAIFKARNLEFFRDKASLSWSLLFPVLLLVGFSVVFSDDNKSIYKAGIVASEPTVTPFEQTRYVEFVHYITVEEGLDKLRKHKVDILVDFVNQQYWINDTSPQGYFIEKVLLQSTQLELQRQTVSMKQIRYLDWVLPGILGMNMMFGCLFGVGYVIVRYRNNMVLKRINATPVTPFEFLSAQILSRLFIVLAISAFIYIGCNLIFDFYMLGSYFDLLLITILGAMSLISLGVLISSRSASQELTGGMLNLFSWPMMIFSGVWFSLEGSPDFIQIFAYLLPLTHLIEGARAIMTEGASLSDIKVNLLSLTLMIAVFLGIASLLFKWSDNR